MLFLLSTTQAASIRALVEVDDTGVRLHRAVIVAEEAAPAAPGELAIRDGEGRLLASVAVEDARHRSVVGVGEAVVLERAFALVEAPWPEGASFVELGGLELAPTLAPPSAVAVSESGPDDERLDIVYLGDGYTADQLDTYAEDVDRISAYLMSIEPYGAYSGLFNIWRIDEASNESGASHYDRGQNDARDTAYGCFYGCGGIDRLLCCDDQKVLGAVMDQVPGADGVLVLVNDPTYGGAGGFEYATSYTANPTGSLVAAHEIGHSLVGLWDEYSYGQRWQGSEGPNCALDGDDPPWSAWVGDQDVDAYTPCSYLDHHRPTQWDCMMNTLQDDYCAVCREQAVLAIYEHLPRIVLSKSPAETEVRVSEATTFSVEALGPDGGGLSYLWTLDGEVVGTDASLVVESCASGALTLEVWDGTPWVRSDPEGKLRDTVTWQLDCSGAASDTGDPRRPSPAPDCGGCDTGSSPWIGLFAALIVVVPRRRCLQ